MNNNYIYSIILTRKKISYNIESFNTCTFIFYLSTNEKPPHKNMITQILNK